VRRQQDLVPAEKNDTALVVLAAARLGRARLIDNLSFERPVSASP
jgi:pantoate--beta-alanine ligase